MTKEHVVVPYSVGGTLLSFLLLATFVAVGALVVRPFENGSVIGCVAFLLYRIIVVRFVICWHHRAGVHLARSGKFRDALPAFERSERFFQRHRRLDRLRGLLLGSSGKYSFLTLAKYNQAYCLARLKEAGRAHAIVRELLANDPHNSMAQALLDVLDAGAGLVVPPQAELPDNGPSP